MNEVPSSAEKATPSPHETKVKRELASVEAYRQNLTRLQEFIAKNHRILETLPNWEVYVWSGEIRVDVWYSQRDPKAIAALFPGEWRCGVKPDLGYTDRLDWTSHREPGVKIRLCGAVRLEPQIPEPRLATF